MGDVMAVAFDRRIMARYRILETAMAREGSLSETPVLKNKRKNVESQKVAGGKSDEETLGRPRMLWAPLTRKVRGRNFFEDEPPLPLLNALESETWDKDSF